MLCVRSGFVLFAVALALLLGASSSLPAGASTLIVNSTDDNDDGVCDATHCSLREAVGLAETGDAIAFNIPPADPGYNAVLGVWTIRPAALYVVNNGITIDGATQTANQGDSNVLGPEIEVDGSSHTDVCFRLSSGDVLRGLVINRCGSQGVVVRGPNNVVAGNYIGTDATGTLARPNNLHGVFIFVASDNTIGGTTPADRNVISANKLVGIGIADPTSEGNRVIGNYIGTDRTGSLALGNEGSGIFIRQGAHDNTIGGDTAAQRNVISGNEDHGVHILRSDILEPSAYNNVVKGNYIGADASGMNALGNGQFGVAIFNGPANNVVGPGNTIAYNGIDGVLVDGSEASETVGNRITANSIHSNSGLGINRLRGGNLEPAPPVITGVGSVSGTACAACTVEVFSDAEDEGRVFAGSTVADGAGNWTLNVVAPGPNVTATATDAAGNTSEFSAPVEVPPFLKGDIDCDGSVTSVDALFLLREVALLPVDLGPGCPAIDAAAPASVSAATARGDIDCDGGITSVDALFLLRHVAHLDVALPGGCAAIGP